MMENVALPAGKGADVFWLGLLAYLGVEIAYQFSDTSYFWFANAQQAQTAVLGTLLFAEINPKDIIKKVAAWLIAIWSIWIVLSDWSSATDTETSIIELLLLVGWGAYSVFRFSLTLQRGNRRK